jgi:hypothetical protein
VRADQQSIRESVNRMITEGLQDIRGRLECITVTEIIGQIPEGFRADLQRQLMEAAQQTVLDLTERLNTIPFEEINKTLVINSTNTFRRSKGKSVIAFKLRFPKLKRP